MSSSRRCPELVCIDSARVHEFWLHVEPLIKRAMARGTLSDYDALQQKVWCGHALLWIVWDGAKICAVVVTSIKVVNRRKQCLIVACAGEEKDRWLSLIADIENYARDEGCVATVVIGRRGWQRVLKEYRPKAVVLERIL